MDDNMDDSVILMEIRVLRYGCLEVSMSSRGLVVGSDADDTTWCS